MRLLWLTLSALCSSFVACTAAAASLAEPVGVYTPRVLKPREVAADIALLRRALETIHPGLVRYTDRTDINAAFDRLEADARAPLLSDLDLWRDIAVMLARIHCDHTKTESSAAIAAYRDMHPTHLPLRFRLIEGRMMVVSNDGQAGAPPPGTEILAVNGRPTPVVLATLSRAVAYDGDTDQAVAAKLADDSDLAGDDFNEYWPAFFGFPVQWDLAFKSPGSGHITHATLRPIGFADWTHLGWPGAPYRSEFYDAVRWRLTRRLAYLRIDTFVNYRNPVDADAFLAAFFKTLKSTGADRLVLDLRENGGGSEDVSTALARYLLPSTFTWSKPVRLKAIRYGDLPLHIESWGDRTALFEPSIADFRRTPDGWWERIPRADRDDDQSALAQTVSSDRYAGPVTVLVGARNGSGATRTIAQLKEKIGARLVGEDTGGSAEGPTAGHIFLITLPASGLKVRIPTAWNRTNLENFAPRLGVAADQLVVSTILDAAVDRDQTLEIAKSTPPPAPSLGRALAGAWTGALEYRDFGNDRRATLPTRLSATADGESAQLAFAIDDGPGKKVATAQRWSLADDGVTLVVAEGASVERFSVVERVGEADGQGLTLVADGAGQDNGVAVRARLILTRRGDRLSISRLTQKPGEPALLRDGYVLTAAQ